LRSKGQIQPQGRDTSGREPGELAVAAKERERVLAESAEEIRKLGKRAGADVIEIGRRLTETKKICGHGNWLPWLQREFGWTDRHALKCMQVYELRKLFGFGNPRQRTVSVGRTIDAARGRRGGD
jgi:hypothetical protein